MRPSHLTLTAIAATLCTSAACQHNDSSADSTATQFVTVSPDGRFMRGDSAYNFVGTNFWYGAILASEGTGGNRARLIAELDTLHAMGLDNLRILVGGDGESPAKCQISPTLQHAPGVYNDTILRGLDYLLSEMEKRGMLAVLYLNNTWEWSGGFGKYLEWAGAGDCPMPYQSGYKAYTDYVSQFMLNDSARDMSYDHVRNIVSRTNTITGLPYAESPAIMAWQIANEPRCFSQNGKEPMLQWIDSTANIIRSIDPNHLISTGSEGSWGCENDIDLWRRIHQLEAIDYATIHIWPYNWSWISDSTTLSGVNHACELTMDYIARHDSAMGPVRKPIVLEEFGYPRDHMSTTPGSPTSGRDTYYTHIFDIVASSGMLQGANFWGWGGLALPNHTSWMPDDDYTGDPAQEPQGLNSVFASDSSTVAVILHATGKCNK